MHEKTVPQSEPILSEAEPTAPSYSAESWMPPMKEFRSVLSTSQKEFLSTISSNSATWKPLFNIFNLCLVIMGLTIFCLDFVRHRVPFFFVLLALIGLTFGVVGQLMRNVMLMGLYSVFNFIALVITSSYLGYGETGVGICFGLLIVNQVKSIDFTMRYYRELIQRQQQLL